MQSDENMRQERDKMNIEKQIEFDKVKELWTGLAVTDWAKEIISEVSLYFSERELRKRQPEGTCP